MLACSGTQIPVLSVNGSDFRDISYGTGTTGEGPHMFTLSLYSHSQVVGSGNGSRRGRQDARMLHYYTAVGNYARFASDFLGSSVTVTDAETDAPLTNYTQVASPVPAAPGVVAVGGDVFGPDNAVSTTTEATSTATATSATAPESHSASDEAALGGRQGLSAGAIAGIAIAAAVVVAAVAAVATRYALVARRRRCAEAYWDREIAKVQSARSLPPMSPALDDTSVDPQK
ncbi:hypothetical protein H4R19_003543 [Coemansia spiralis]|nr:hypothetical protein H4R19_003543 [Coemansia spiralis]